LPKKIDRNATGHQTNAQRCTCRQPGEKSVMHSHPESIGVFLTDVHAKFTYPDGRNEDIDANAGSVLHMDAFTHLPEGTSGKPFEVIQVELKR